MTVKYDLAEINQTSFACPSQWEGKLTDGRMFYIRYRHSVFTFYVSENPTNNLYDAMKGGPLVRHETDEDDGGWMGINQVISILESYGVILS